MKYKVLLEKGDYALILRGTRMEEYAVVSGLDKEKECWDWTCCYYYFGDFTQIDETEALSSALDYFRMKTEENYIPRPRLEELATLLKDRLLEYDEEEYLDFEMTDEEKEWFGIETESEDK